MTAKQRFDPRTTKCPVNQYERHRWAKSFKDQVSKACYVTFLRCRYCAHFVTIQFERVVMPSGRVIVTERVSAVAGPGEVTAELQTERTEEADTKRTVNPQDFAGVE